jgi:hypothetical protein
LRGWFEYFKHSHRATFPPLDGWIRRRLRNILRKRSRRKGISRGYDNIRWPNAFFAEHGLFSLHQPMSSSASPLAGKTINRRAGCGRSARPVRREGVANPIAAPYPYHLSIAPKSGRNNKVLPMVADPRRGTMNPGRSLSSGRAERGAVGRGDD